MAVGQRRAVNKSIVRTCRARKALHGRQDNQQIDLILFGPQFQMLLQFQIQHQKRIADLIGHQPLGFGKAIAVEFQSDQCAIALFFHLYIRSNPLQAASMAPQASSDYRTKQ